jgi:RimJ/RimL family protein N-acetyltransferase
MGARGVLSVIHPENAASIRVAERLGATHERDHFSKGLALRVYVHPDP